MTKFTINYSSDAKRIFIFGPWELSVEIDHDDVDQEQVRRDARKLCKMLDKHWNVKGES